jgi:hypothetical protein
MTLKPDQQAKKIRAEVFHHMCKTRGWKYRVFLRYLLFFKYIAFAPTRGEFLESYYVLMRYLDDIVDGDLPLSKSYKNEIEYLNGKIEFSKNLVNPKDEIDSLMMYCFKLAEEFGEDFHSETTDILNALMFDARRRGKEIIFPKGELFYHFHLMDVRGTIRATLKIFKDDPDKYRILEPLGIACRHQYNIEDFEADVAAGYINISLEEFERFGIRREDLHNTSSPVIVLWLRHHAKEGLSLLSEHNRILPQGNFSLLEKAVFKVVYELPARKAFLKFLSRTQNQDSGKSYE